MTQTIINATEIKSQTQVVGRWAIKSIHGIVTLYSTNLGSEIRFHVKHSRFISCHFFSNGNPFGAVQTIAMRVDHTAWQRFSTTHMPATIQFDQSEHLVEIMLVGNSDLDDVWYEQQGFALTNLSVSDGAKVWPAKARTPVTIIGDSITSGCWINGHQPSVDYAAEANYAAICSDILNLDICRISYSAAGLLRPGTGNVPTAPQFIDHIDHTTPWLPSRPTKLVILNLGVNDRQFSATEFEQRLVSFINQVQSMFATQIVVLIPFAQTFAPVFRRVVPLFNQTKLIETKDWKLSYTDGLHPNLRGSLVAGQQLARALRPII